MHISNRLVVACGSVLTVALFTPPASAGPKGDALRACQVAWKDHKATKDYTPAPKGQGRQAYWTYVKACQAKKVT